MTDSAAAATTDDSVEKEDGSDAGHGGHGHKMRTGQGWGKGIIADVKRTILTHWKGEMTNLNGKVSLYLRNDVRCFMCLPFSAL